MTRTPTSRAPGLNLRRAETRRLSRQLAELDARISNLNEEMQAVVNYLRDHQSRLALHEDRLLQQEERFHAIKAKIDWLLVAVRHILNSRAWKFLGIIGRLTRRLFGRSQSTLASEIDHG